MNPALQTIMLAIQLLFGYRKTIKDLKSQNEELHLQLDALQASATAMAARDTDLKTALDISHAVQLDLRAQLDATNQAHADLDAKVVDLAAAVNADDNLPATVDPATNVVTVDPSVPGDPASSSTPLESSSSSSSQGADSSTVSGPLHSDIPPLSATQVAPPVSSGAPAENPAENDAAKDSAPIVPAPVVPASLEPAAPATQSSVPAPDAPASSSAPAV